jgi:TP901 family phage tail tape measure protein
MQRSIDLANKQTQSFGFMGKALKSIQYRIINAVEDALYQAVRAVAEFDQSLKKLQAISGATEAQVSVMGNTLRHVAITTTASLGEVAQGMVYIAQSGFNASETIAAIGATANLATGTMEDMSKTADLLTSTIRAFGMQAGEATKVSDIMANAINKSKLSVEKLRVSMSYVGATAHSVGMSLEEATAATMTLADAGIRMSTIGTGMRQILSRLQAPTLKMRETFAEMGLSVDDFNFRTKGTTEVLKNLSRVLTTTKLDAQNNEIQVLDTAKAYKLFGVWAANSALVLANAFNSGNYQRALANVQRTGSAAEMAEIQMRGLEAQFKNLLNTIEDAFIGISEAGGFKDAIGAMITGLKEVIDWVKKFGIAFVETTRFFVRFAL